MTPRLKHSARDEATLAREVLKPYGKGIPDHGEQFLQAKHAPSLSAVLRGCEQNTPITGGFKRKGAL